MSDGSKATSFSFPLVLSPLRAKVGGARSTTCKGLSKDLFAMASPRASEREREGEMDRERDGERKTEKWKCVTVMKSQ